ncbi:MAG: PhnD/SsuA/transferrin family substrate-binding protein [Lentisphaerae bacterium]|jgi:phosphonate transport system substrate-binding protein|nr:PhnD/SsuA/transferrin family substrate-binding protein [Lentisphaerota bacterium]MBT5606379.1 PhnD/SsuA/transferrin family substrate-binding protein [Lentisphaerota bacterium]MBT7056766.1 PhnD/SsuA/transferrin family substrate-binding protein [Lentisphaerota bacterium]MBT7840371.1 PhnD/SsuA/transferrin family substrate-binding protein [Lentisphaerota bacterium]
MASHNSPNAHRAPASTARKVRSYLAMTGVALGCLFGVWKALRPEPHPYVDFAGGRPDTDEESGAVIPETDNSDSLRFAVATMWSVQSTFTLYRQLVTRIARDTGRKSAFVLRPSYTELRHAFERGQIDVAFVCAGPYVRMLSRGSARLLVQPEFVPGLSYHSALVVPESSSATCLTDLAGKSIAFSDRESFTGCLVPCLSLVKQGADPGTFFGKVIYSGSHDQSIEAVDRGLADAAALHSIVWRSAIRAEPALGQRLKVIHRSEAFGPPPVVVPCGGDLTLQASIQEALLALHTDSEGVRILEELSIRRFIPPRARDYDTAVDVYEQLQAATESMP